MASAECGLFITILRRLVILTEIRDFLQKIRCMPMVCEIMKYTQILLTPLLVCAINNTAHPFSTTTTTESSTIIAARFIVQSEGRYASLCHELWECVFVNEISKRELFTSSDGLRIMTEILNRENLCLRSGKNHKPKENVSNSIDSVLHELVKTVFLDKHAVLEIPNNSFSEDKEGFHRFCKFLEVVMPASDDCDFKPVSDLFYSNIIDGFTKLGLKDDSLEKVINSLDLAFKSLEAMCTSLLPYIEEKKEAIIEEHQKKRIFKIFSSRSSNSNLESKESNLINSLKSEYVTNCMPFLQHLHLAHYTLLTIERKRNNDAIPQMAK